MKRIVVLFFVAVSIRTVVGPNTIGQSDHGGKGKKSLCGLPFGRKRQPKECSLDKWLKKSPFESSRASDQSTITSKPAGKTDSTKEQLPVNEKNQLTKSSGEEPLSRSVAFKEKDESPVQIDENISPESVSILSLATIRYQHVMDKQAKIGFCTASAVDLQSPTNGQREEEQCILVTSAECGEALKTTQKSWLFMAWEGKSKPESLQLQMKDVLPDQEGSNQAITLVKTNKKCIGTRSDLPILPSIKEIPSVRTKGTVTWCTYTGNQYDPHLVARSGHLHPIYHFMTRTTVYHCPEGVAIENVFCAALEGVKTEETGLPFYAEARDGRIVLKGVRSVGNQFINLGLFGERIRSEAQNPNGWVELRSAGIW